MIGLGIGINKRKVFGGYIDTLVNAYVDRVTADGGVVEAKSCVKAAFKELGAEPIIPIAFAATGVGATSFTANWKPETDAYLYLLDVSLSPTFDTFVLQDKIIYAPASSYTVTGLSSDTTYYYRIRVSTESIFDADYQEVLDYAITQGYTLPSVDQQVKQNQLVLDLKDAGVWSKLDTFAVFATDGDSDFALIDWIRLAQNIAVNSPTFTTNQGFTTDGTSSTVSITYNASTSGTNYLLNDASFGVYKFSGAGARGVRSVGLIASAIDFADTGLGWTGVNSNNFQAWTNVFTVNNNFKSIHRTANNSISAYEDATFRETQATLSTGTPTGFEIGRDHFQFSSWTCSIFYAGSSLISEISGFSNAINTYISAI